MTVPTQAKAFFAWIDSLDVDFDPALHNRLDLQIQSFNIHHQEGEFVRLSITCENPGIGLLAPGRPKYALLSVSLAGETPKLMFRGIVNSTPTNLEEQLVTLEFLAQPDDQDDKLEAYARSISVRPFVDPLISGSYREPSTALVARSATYYIDPITHAFSLNDMLDWDEVIDIGPMHDRSKFQIAMNAPPLASVTVTGVAEWAQEAKGTVDIADLVNWSGGAEVGVRSLTELDSIAESFDIRDADGQSGWSVANVTHRGLSPSETVRKFRTGQAQHVILQKQVGVDGDGDPIFYNWVDTIFEISSLASYHFVADSYDMAYNYSQPRREVLQVKLEADIQDIQMFGYTEEDLDDIHLDSLVNDPAEPWQEQTDYLTGDRVTKQDKAWVCQEDHNSGYDPFQRILPQYANVPKQLRTKDMWRWLQVKRDIAISDKRANAFFTIDRGREVAAHLVLRARALLRKRMRCLEATLTGRWEDLGDITLKNGLRIVHDYFQTEGNAAIGKVISYTKNWDGKTQTFSVDVTIGIAAGKGYSNLPEIENLDGYSDAFAAYSSDVDADITDQVEDVQFTINGDPVRSTCNPYKLGSPAYACISVQYEMLADQQLAIASRAEASGRSARQAVQDNPTKFRVQMRGIDGLDLITRMLTVSSGKVQGPKGIDLGWGG